MTASGHERAKRCSKNDPDCRCGICDGSWFRCIHCGQAEAELMPLCPARPKPTLEKEALKLAPRMRWPSEVERDDAQAALASVLAERNRANAQKEMVIAELERTQRELAQVYDALHLVGSDRCVDGAKGAIYLNRNAICLQKERADEAIRERDEAQAALAASVRKATALEDKLLGLAAQVIALTAELADAKAKRGFIPLSYSSNDGLDAISANRLLHARLASERAEADQKLEGVTQERDALRAQAAALALQRDDSRRSDDDTYRKLRGMTQERDALRFQVAERTAERDAAIRERDEARKWANEWKENPARVLYEQGQKDLGEAVKARDRYHAKLVRLGDCSPEILASNPPQIRMMKVEWDRANARILQLRVAAKNVLKSAEWYFIQEKLRKGEFLDEYDSGMVLHWQALQALVGDDGES